MINSLSKKNQYQIKIVALLLSFIIIYTEIKKIKKLFEHLKLHNIEIFPFKKLFNNIMKNNTILIIEINNHHYECTPGFSKYFIDIGYKVDILMHKSGIDSFYLFNQTGNIKLFIFQNDYQIRFSVKDLSSIIQKYDFILLQTTNKKRGPLYNNLCLTNINTSFFVFHTLDNIEKLNYSNYLYQNRIFTIGNFSRGLQLNPHYFGDIKIKNKNIKTRFFVTSTTQRNYKYLISSALRLKLENFNFEIISIGRADDFNLKHIPFKLHNNFIFKYRISYKKLYEAVESSDFIIIPLDPTLESDIKYRTIQSSGSIQLAYGFLKPIIIDESFAKIYNLNSENSLIYKNNNIYDSMKEAIFLDNENYKKLQGNLKKSVKVIYQKSLDNLKKALKK